MEKVRMTIRIVPDLDRCISELSDKRGTCKNAVITEACWEYVNQMKGKMDKHLGKEDVRGAEEAKRSPHESGHDAAADS